MMMLKQLFINSFLRLSGLLVVFFLLIPVCAFSKEDVKKDPIVVTSKMLTIDNENNTAVFEHSVVAEAPEMTLYADKMFIFYNQDTRTITRINALGRVKVVEQDRVITADEATYYAHDERVIFKGDLKVVEGKRFISGEQNTPSR
jgi:lipopolysaccharide export system protein LptA